MWTAGWDWSTQGDEWSVWWGGTEAMWYGAVRPRIHSFVPTGTILEIAPGYGRWTQYLKELGSRVIAVDISENCVEHCRKRFADASNVEVHVNDGMSLGMVPDGIVDFAFSFDSLVHVEDDVIAAYLRELARTLAPDGVGFVHHSNIGAYPRHTRVARRTRPDRARRVLVRSGVLIDVYAWRAESMTAERFQSLCTDADLVCVGQEKINWESGRFLIDTLSIITRPGSRWDRQPVVVRNPSFRHDAGRMATLYASTAYPRDPG
ncbi:MAG: hypothetical protein QOD92_1682 [Acidimicrobiaceae bacterium]